MSKIKTLKTSWTAGELSPTIDGRPDLAKFQNGAAILENYLIIPQGGIYRRYGSRYVAECKDSAANIDRRVRNRRFVFGRGDAFMLEFGHLYVRFYKNGAAILVAGLPYTVVTPYTAAELFDLHFEQSADVLFIDHPAHTPQKLSRVADDDWTIGNMARTPPPTEEDLTDLNGLSGTVTLTPGTGADVQGTLNVVFTASAAIFLAGDVDRNIVYGSARAVITEVTDTSHLKCTILDAFPSLGAIASHSWFIDKSPSSDAQCNKKTHLGQTINIKFKNDSSDEDAIRAVDVGKYMKLQGGIVRITEWVSAHEINGHVEVALKLDGPANPKVVGGDWTLEVEAWTTVKGWPVSPLFYQGRLTHVGRPAGTFILSASDDFENYGIGARANNALQYTITRQQASLNWGADLGDLLLATPESIFAAVAPGTNVPLGGDTVPLVRRQDAPGSLGVQPLVTGTAALYIEASTLRLRELRYSPDQSQRTPYVALDLTLLADHICGKGGFVKDKIAWAEIPNRHAFIPRADGQLPALTYYTTPEQVAGWSRIVTDGIVESVDVIPRPDGIRDQTWLIVRRTINGVDHRYIEYFEDAASNFAGGVRAWEALYTDSAVVYSGAAATNVPVGTLAHLEGKEVDVIVDKGMIQTKGDNDDGTPIRFTVVDGRLDTDLQEEHTLFEIGLHYESKLVTMRPAVEGAVIEDEMKMYDRITVKLKDSIGCEANGQDMDFDIGGQPQDQSPPLFTGNKRVSNSGWDADGRIEIKQKLPLPQMILGLTLRLNTGGL